MQAAQRTCGLLIPPCRPLASSVGVGEGAAQERRDQPEARAPHVRISQHRAAQAGLGNAEQEAVVVSGRVAGLAPYVLYLSFLTSVELGAAEEHHGENRWTISSPR